jgi:hypothetical protein
MALPLAGATTFGSDSLLAISLIMALAPGTREGALILPQRVLHYIWGVRFFRLVGLLRI